MPDTSQYLITIRNAGDEYQRLVALTAEEVKQLRSTLVVLEDSSCITDYTISDAPPSEESLEHLLNWAHDCADAPDDEECE